MKESVTQDCFSLVLEAADLGTWDWDLRTNCLTWSARCLSVFGLPADTAITYERFLQAVHPADRGAVEKAVREAIHSHSDYDTEMRTVWPDGTLHWVASRGRAFYDASGQPTRMLGIVIDITERKRSEEELRLTTDRFKVSLRGSPIVVFNQDLDLRYTWLYCPDLGHSPAEIIGKRDSEIYPRQEDAAMTEAIKSEVIRTGRKQRREIVLHWRGKERLYDLLVDPLFDSQGKIAGVTCAAIDISERKQAQEAMIRSEKLASLGRMAATIAHEINNPLEGVMNLIYLAANAQGVPDQARQYMDTASEELKRIAQITRQSLGFYRESGKPALTSVNAALESAVDLLRTKIMEKNAVVQKQWDEEVQVLAIAGELRQVFANLLANSLDAITENGVIALRISRCSGHKTEGPCVRITIADNGVGINASMRQQVFDALFTTKGAIGTGLGLWVSKQIVDKHSGTIRLRSTTDKFRHGTVFSIVLPAEPAQNTQAACA